MLRDEPWRQLASCPGVMQKYCLPQSLLVYYRRNLERTPTLSLISRLTHAFNMAQRLRNPVQVFLSRAFRKSDRAMLIVDRQTGVRISCLVGSYPMFSAAWYAREYDIPGYPLQPGDIVLDIGANQGFFTCLAAQQGAQVYAFEPNPDSFARLALNVRTNNFSHRVVAHPWAIASREGSATLMISRELAGGMSTIIPEFARNASISISGTVTVPAYTLPQLIERFHIAHVRLCKIDAEGAELDILGSIPASVRNLIDIFVAEIHPQAYRPTDLLDLISSWGTHQLSYAEPSAFSANIVRAISTRLLSPGI